MVCWGAWWQNISASDVTQSMAIKQDVKISSASATHGIYALECQASTDHYCLSDQHANMTVNGETLYSDTLTADYLDIDVENRWQTLSTSPVYLNDNPTMTIGFEGSKKGATDGLWLEVGNTTATQNDKREGSWCATNFAFRYIPIYIKTVVPGQYGIICLPYNVRPTETLSFYKIVGINPEYTQLCLEPLDELTGGVPCIYRSTVANAQFYEYGEAAAKAASTGVDGNLRGFYQTSSMVPAGNFAIMDGAFKKVTSDNRPAIGNWGAFMRAFTDNSSQVIPVIESWSGETIAISGVTDDEKAKNGERMLGIQLPTNVNQLKADGLYTIEGRRVATDSPWRSGLYIKVVGGRAYKIIVK